MKTIEKLYWWDPTGMATWHDMDAVKRLEPARCVTIAEVIYETDNWIVTAASHSNIEGSETEYADITVIPKGCITLREPYIKETTNNDLADKQQ